MTVSEKQRNLIEMFSGIPDPQERLAAVVDRGKRGSTLPAEERVSGNRVPGCVSPVWVSGIFLDGVMRFRSEAESPVVRGLVRLLCDLYDGGVPAEIVAIEPTLFDELGLAKDLSPTRRNGLASVRQRIRELAAQAIPLSR